MNEPTVVTPEAINAWADDAQGPVALHLKQKLVPVEVDGRVIFPPTYANIGYNIDTLSDGRKVATIDSVGSQANRMEPIFKHEPYSKLVPQIYVELHRSSPKETEEGYIEQRSLLDLAHRSADAVVSATPTLSTIIQSAFLALKQKGDAGPLCRVAPTSLVFGVWDSRGDSQEKRPRLVRSIIRAWDVQPLHAAAQFNSVWKSLNEDQQSVLQEEAKKQSIKLSKKGFADAPAIFRKTDDKIPEFKDGEPNPACRVLGGVLVNGSIERDVTVNLVALRGISGANDQETQSIRRYLLGLTLIAATAEIDLFLREGCHLRFADDDVWNEIPRRGASVPIGWPHEESTKMLTTYTQQVVQCFVNDWPELSHCFDLVTAKKLLAKKSKDGEDES